ncbi:MULTISPECIES: hypothetical protein [unclassified Ensifer]|uniref:hypothetical protein n=1 Tax=unclassified Ensifer TaxID=2633371 RepID=UPI0008132B44|nr:MULTISPECIES: hypothetical protein [unclassified Ensifer]OCP08002.1 hypothetical protein BC362_10350 [Ensifer sp. LC14]OCP10888.1 hypothetical protein BC374_17615 [Ensifer sp. LC13]OCP11566.1 hypothetical protein BBX50_18240 [Ensifer sp. LC11]OCP33385.1 hypothetical protein BC364_17130 [Ensifer sp. LC499]
MLIRIFLAAIFTLLPTTFASAQDLELEALKAEQKGLKQQAARLVTLLLLNDPEKGGEIAKWAAKCTSPCVLPKEYTGGGNTQQFRATAYLFVISGKELQVKGSDVCNSACTILVDQVSYYGGKTCVGWDMAWGVHTAAEPAPDGSYYLSPDQYRYEAPAIREWIAAQGGMKPGFRYRYVPSELVEQTYGLCPGTTKIESPRP